MRRLAAVFSVTTTATLLSAGAASADVTLGSPNASGTGSPCGPTTVMAELADDPTTPYTVPASGGRITRWQVNATGATPGASVTLVALKSVSAGHDQVVALDTETLPASPPAGGIASFTPATPLAVTGGEVLGLYSSSTSVTCFWFGGGTPSGDAIMFLQTAGAPTVGATLAQGAQSGGGFAINVAATLVTSQDAGVSTAATGGLAGQLALLSSSVTNAGPNTDPITFTDTVPSGLTIDSAVAGSGACVTSAQQVTCTISGLAVGQSAPVDIVVTPTASGTYANPVTVATAAPDPNPANDTASATLTVSAPPVPPSPSCTVPTLRGIPLSLANQLLVLLHCKPGKLTHAFSNTVAKGLVITTTPRAGSYPNATTVGLQLSSGRKPKKKKPHHR